MTAVEAPESHLRENPFEIARDQLRRVADLFAIDNNLVQVLQECKKAVVRLGSGDDGRRHACRCSRATASAQRGARPVQGRHPLPPGRDARRGEGARDVDDLEVRAVNIPFGGAKGGVACDPKTLSERELRAADAALHDRDHATMIGPEKDIPAPDVGTDRADDGVDHGHVLDEQGPLGARRRHRQAAQRRRLAGPRWRRPSRGGALLHPRGAAQGRAAARGTDASSCRASATSAASSPRVPARGGRARWSRSPTSSGGVYNPHGHRHPGGDPAQGRDRLARRRSATPSRSPTRSSSLLECDVLVPARAGAA